MAKISPRHVSTQTSWSVCRLRSARPSQWGFCHSCHSLKMQSSGEHSGSHESTSHLTSFSCDPAHLHGETIASASRLSTHKKTLHQHTQTETQLPQGMKTCKMTLTKIPRPASSLYTKVRLALRSNSIPVWRRGVWPSFWPASSAFCSV